MLKGPIVLGHQLRDPPPLLARNLPPLLARSLPPLRPTQPVLGVVLLQGPGHHIKALGERRGIRALQHRHRGRRPSLQQLRGPGRKVHLPHLHPHTSGGQGEAGADRIGTAAEAPEDRCARVWRGLHHGVWIRRGRRGSTRPPCRPGRSAGSGDRQDRCFGAASFQPPVRLDRRFPSKRQPRRRQAH